MQLFKSKDKHSEKVKATFSAYSKNSDEISALKARLDEAEKQLAIVDSGLALKGGTGIKPVKASTDLGVLISSLSVDIRRKQKLGENLFSELKRCVVVAKEAEREALEESTKEARAREKEDLDKEASLLAEAQAVRLMACEEMEKIQGLENEIKKVSEYLDVVQDEAEVGTLEGSLERIREEVEENPYCLVDRLSCLKVLEDLSRGIPFEDGREGILGSTVRKYTLFVKEVCLFYYRDTGVVFDKVILEGTNSEGQTVHQVGKHMLNWPAIRQAAQRKRLISV